MTPHEPTDDLTRLLRDAVDDIEPRPGLEAIRSRTSPLKESSMNPFRTWILGGLGAAVATAAVIGGVVLVANNDDPGADNPPPASETSQTPSETPTDEPTQDPSETPTDDPTDPATTDAPDPELMLVPVYYVGDTPMGPRLYREFHQVRTADKLSTAADQAVSQAPDDRDYQMPWTDGVHATASYNGDFISVDLTAVDKPGMGVHDPFPGMTQEQAELAVQQVIYTVQGALGEGRVPVQFLIDGSHTDQVLGQPASEPLANGPVTETLSLINLTTPSEGDTVSGTLDVTGVANSFEANVTVRLQRFEGTYIAFDDFITAEGCCEDKLFPFSKSFDISDVEPGTYILMVSTDDPSAGEGPGPFTDTKVIAIE